jgi:hypothetical protein
MHRRVHVETSGRYLPVMAVYQFIELQTTTSSSMLTSPSTRQACDRLADLLRRSAHRLCTE